MSGEPVRIIFVEQRKVVQFVAEFGAEVFILRERAEFGGRELVLLQFAEQLRSIAGAKPGRRALWRNNFNSSSWRNSNARKTMTRPSSDKSSGGVTFSFSKTNCASRSKEKMCSRV